MAQDQKRPSNGRKHRPVAARVRTTYPLTRAERDDVWDVLDATQPLREHAN